MEDAEVHAIAGQCADARSQVSRGLELGRDNFVLERASRTLALCGGGDNLQRLTDDLARRFPAATLTMRLQLPVISAALAIARRESARAIELLDPVKSYEHAPAAEFWPVYLRGQALLQRRDGRGAGDEFQAIVDHRGEAPASPLYALAHLGLARAASLTGDKGRARKAYEEFFSLWKGADTGLTPLTEAHLEYARLQ